MLELFGSAARAADFHADSDADFLVEFAPEAATGLNSFFGLKFELEKLLALFGTPTCYQISIVVGRASMARDPRAYLWDARVAAKSILIFIQDLDARHR